MNPGAQIVASIDKAHELFPPITCAQCQGRGQVQRYGKRPCQPCNGTGKNNAQPCAACQQERGQPGTGYNLVPETIPCPRCQGKATLDRVRQTQPQTLAQIKVGDLVKVVVSFNTPRPGDLPAGIPHPSEQAEIIVCMVTGGSTQAIQTLVHSAPQYGQYHGLRFRSPLTLAPAQIVYHHQSTAEELEQAKNGNLFQRDLPVIPAQPGEFFTRQGNRAQVFTIRTQGDGSQIAIGKVDGADHDWQPTGQSRSNPGCDLVALSTGTAFVADA